MTDSEIDLIIKSLENQLADAMHKRDELQAEVNRLREREHVCPTATEAQARAWLRGLQEVAEALGYSDNQSPAEIVEAAKLLRLQYDELLTNSAQTVNQ